MQWRFLENAQWDRAFHSWDATKMYLDWEYIKLFEHFLLQLREKSTSLLFGQSYGNLSGDNFSRTVYGTVLFSFVQLYWIAQNWEYIKLFVHLLLQLREKLSLPSFPGKFSDEY